MRKQKKAVREKNTTSLGIQALRFELLRFKLRSVGCECDVGGIVVPGGSRTPTPLQSQPLR